jgi:hypothetical protein
MTAIATAVAAKNWVGALRKIFTKVILIKVKRRSLHYGKR